MSVASTAQNNSDLYRGSGYILVVNRCHTELDINKKIYQVYVKILRFEMLVFSKNSIIPYIHYIGVCWCPSGHTRIVIEVKSRIWLVQNQVSERSVIRCTEFYPYRLIDCCHDWSFSIKLYVGRFIVYELKISRIFNFYLYVSLFIVFSYN